MTSNKESFVGSPYLGMKPRTQLEIYSLSGDR